MLACPPIPRALTCTARALPFQCCGEKDFKGVASCPTKLVHPPEANYHLRYQVQYTRDTSSVKPIIISIATVPDCAAFYDVLRNDDQPERADTYEYTVPKRATVLYAVGHQHTGALNISMYVNGKRTCTSYPTYGTQVTSNAAPGISDPVRSRSIPTDLIQSSPSHATPIPD